MGVATRRPILPAPTDSSAFESAEDTGFNTDLATDLSRATDRTSHTIPDDGSPITISTSTKRVVSGKLAKADHHSQTSLLIEYFEGGKEPNTARRPSVRVKVTPSSSRKAKNIRDGHLVVTEANGPRKASYSRHISLGTDSPHRSADPGSVSSLESLGEARVHRTPGVEVEVLQRDGSDVSGAGAPKDLKYVIPPSDISSMPPDSLLEGNTPMRTTHVDRSRGVQDETSEVEILRPPVINQEVNASRERLTQKVIEKLSNKPRTSSGSRRRNADKSRSRSVSKELVDSERRDSGRKSGRHRDERPISTAGESSMVSNSLLSADARSGDQYSVRSGASKSSINNPRLLETVEDAIKRLILPELKELKKDQRAASGRSKHDRDRGLEISDVSGSSFSREEASRRSSRRYDQDARARGEVIPSGSRRSRRKEADFDSQSERSYDRRESGDSLSIEEGRSHGTKRRDHRARDVAAAALAGGALTAAALHHHESASSLDRRERRKKRSKSRSSRSVSVAEDEDVFHKHEVPPMPMRSEVDSEVTRSSLLSSKTADTATPMQPAMREVIRGSPHEITSPVTETPTKSPADVRRGLGMHHSNFSNRDLNANRDSTTSDVYESQDTERSPESGPRALAAEHFLDDPERVRAYENNLHRQHPIRRGLSPIQSVASYTTTEPNRNSMKQAPSVDSIGSFKKPGTLREEPSYDSLASEQDEDLKKPHRPQGINLESPSLIMNQHENAHRATTVDRDIDDDFYDEQHSQNDKYRESYASDDPKIDLRHMTNYTDDSLDAPYLDKVTAGQQVARGYGANPEYIHTPPGVESAVASLYDPSLVDVRSYHSGNHSHSNLVDRGGLESPQRMRELVSDTASSPLKNRYFPPEQTEVMQQPRINSPVQSVTKSIEEDQEQTRQPERISNPVTTQPSEGQDANSPESEITTNPSVIQGPIGGINHGNRDHWPYNPTPPRPKNDVLPQSGTRDISGMEAATAGGLIAAGLVHGLDNPRDTYMSNQTVPTPPGMKDEGYITSENPRSPGLYTPNGKNKGLSTGAGPGNTMDLPTGDDHPFTSKKNQYLSGLSQGMNSPLYDSTTGRGIERIQSKDIVALMDHLTVRDAQRNARDTEILVTLVRSAAEMRNSFEDMKKFIAEQDDLIMDTADRQHEKTQRLIGGPRPQPTSSRGYPRTVSSEDEDGSKRQNVFKRALRGLSTKNSSELQNIEAMLMQLLGDVEGLRSVQTGHGGAAVGRVTSLNSADNVRAPTDPGYEPEGQAGTSSTGDRSGYFSNNSSRQADYRGGAGGHRESGNRVSTVMEGDEEYDDDQQDTDRPHPRQLIIDGPRHNPSNDTSTPREVVRGVSEPLKTPPRMHQQYSQPISNENTPQQYENTPQMSAGSGGKTKHRSTTSSFFPRISRWSKTTASSFTDNFRGSGQKSRDKAYEQDSRDGDEQEDDWDYDPRGEDRLRSKNTLMEEQDHHDEHRPPSPLIPSQVSDHPKYQAHRNSINLQHPQPRQGPTGRFQHQLETEAQYYGDDPMGSPTSQTSSQWERHHTTFNSTNQNQDQAYSGTRHLSPVSDDTYSEGRRSASSGRGGPPRPAKIRDEEPLVPQRPAKVPLSPSGNRQSTYVDHVAAARGGSPALDKSPAAALRAGPAQVRKPSGPRPLSVQKGDPTAVKRTRFRGSPNQIDSEDEQY